MTLLKVEDMFDHDHIITRDDCKQYPILLKIKSDIGYRFHELIPIVKERKNNYNRAQRKSRGALDYSLSNIFLENSRIAQSMFDDIKEKYNFNGSLGISDRPKSDIFCSIHFTKKQYEDFIKKLK
jgi:hypothetical protein